MQYTLLSLALFFASCAHTNRPMRSVANSEQVEKSTFLLSTDNCKINSYRTLAATGEYSKLAKKLQAETVFVCSPVGELREIVDNYIIESDNPNDYGVSTTSLDLNVSDYHEDGKENLVIYVDTPGMNIQFFMNRERYSIKYGDRKSPCYQEVDLMCPEGQADACYLSEEADYHRCVQN